MSDLPRFALFLLIMPRISTGDNPDGPDIFVFDSLKDALIDIIRLFEQSGA